MRSTLSLRNLPSNPGGTGLTKPGQPGIHPWRQPVGYETFRSRYGPQYKVKPHIFGLDATKAIRFGTLAAGLGAAAGVGAILFFDGVPRVKHDILSKVPFIGSFFVNEVPPEDNPF